MREVLPEAIAVLRERVPPTFETQVRDFLAVHNKGGEPCPRCGTRITQIAPGGFITSYCRGCQH
jgi:formamidopyrimidine-DNA glycosylase